MTSTDWTAADISQSGLEEDPNRVYERLRREAPLTYVPVLGLHVASSYALCAEITSSPDFEGVLHPSGLRTFGEPCIIDVNGPAHASLRGMIDPSLHAAEVNKWVDDLVRPICRRLIEDFEGNGSADLMAEYFEPVSVRSLGNLLGLDEIGSDKLRDWFHRLSRSVGNVAMNEDGTFAHPEGFADGDAAKEDIRAVVGPMIDRWIAHPDNSAISHWLHDDMPPGQTRSLTDVYPTLRVFLLGAMQEPGHAMGSTMLGLFSRPEQLEAVVDDPALIPRAVAEGLRWVAPIWSAAARIALRDTTVGGVALPAGTVVMVSYGSANRDESVYDAATTFDAFRTPKPNLAFGGGAHACAGAHFASQVCRIGFEELFEAIPNIEPADDAGDGFFGWAFRGPTGVHAVWEV